MAVWGSSLRISDKLSRQQQQNPAVSKAKVRWESQLGKKGSWFLLEDCGKGTVLNSPRRIPPGSIVSVPLWRTAYSLFPAPRQGVTLRGGSPQIRESCSLTGGSDVVQSVLPPPHSSACVGVALVCRSHYYSTKCYL